MRCVLGDWEPTREQTYIVYIVEIKICEMCGLIESTKNYSYPPLILETVALFGSIEKRGRDFTKWDERWEILIIHMFGAQGKMRDLKLIYFLILIILQQITSCFFGYIMFIDR